MVDTYQSLLSSLQHPRRWFLVFEKFLNHRSPRRQLLLLILLSILLLLLL